MGKSSQKCKESRQQRREEVARIAKAQALVNEAKKQANPLAAMEAFLKFNKNEMEVTISFFKSAELDETLQVKIMDLMKLNMQTVYEESEWGWKEKEKSEELFDEDASYLVAEDGNGALIAFSHFRFDMDEGRPVLYCYELQLSEAARRKGLGRRMLQILEMCAWKADMERVVLTILKNNPGAKAFFSAMKFEEDETNPEDDYEETFCYEILSKARKPQPIQ